VFSFAVEISGNKQDLRPMEYCKYGDVPVSPCVTYDVFFFVKPKV
jgi:hypothetical protein